MCGWVGSVGEAAGSGEAFVRRGAALLAHRGPDGEGIHLAGTVALGHRRLAIVDTSAAAAQPMTSADGRFTLVYNGEVYNHAALRGSVEGNWEFRGHGDTETVLAVLALEGPGALDRFHGMWSLALHDAREGTLLVARDRYGQKPLYWRAAPGGGLRFGSEVRTLLGDGERPRMHDAAVAEYLATGNYGHLGDRTFLEDVRAFPPGCHAVVMPGDVAPRPVRTWRFPGDTVSAPPAGTEAKAFRELFEDAVTERTLSDVPLGATLSGGIDSSAVVGVLASRGGGTLPVFTAQREGSPFDETRWVDDVAAMWGSRLEVHRVPLHDVDLEHELPAAVRAQEEPFGDPSILAHGRIVEAAAAVGVRVLLGGQGGDEILLGYPHLAEGAAAAALAAGDRGLASAIASRLGLRGRGRMRMLLGAATPSWELDLRVRARRRRRRWLSPRLRRSDDASTRLAPRDDLLALWRECIESTALPHLLHYDDRGTMSRSVEGRMPFLDHRLASLVAAAGPRVLLAGGRRKALLRDACADVLPGSVRERDDKIGFHAPAAEMLERAVPWIRTLLLDGVTESLDLCGRETRESLLAAAERGALVAGDSARLWRLLCVRVWAGTFAVTAGHD